MQNIFGLQFLPVDAKAQILTGERLEDLVQQLSGWEITDYGGRDALYKTYKVKNFLDAQNLACKLGNMAEQYNHHPLLSYTWGQLEVYWYTHSLGGIHTNDIFLAQETENIANKSSLLQ